MKALVKERPEPGLTLTEVPEPSVGLDDVLIEVQRTGICGTDLHIRAWDRWAQEHVPTPLVIGHEFAGRVVEIGANVDNVARGDLVSGEGHLVCGQCRHCLEGRRHLCSSVHGLGVQRPGSFAELVALPKTNVWKHKEEVDLDVASIFDPFGNAVHSTLAFPVLGEDVLITGAGPIGIMAALIARYAGARHIVITDVNEWRLELARKLGVEHTVDVRERTLGDVVAELGMQEGFDVGLEMSGSHDALRDMIAHMAHGGSIALLGLSNSEAHLDWSGIVLKMLTLKGIYGRRIYHTWYAASAMVQSGLDISPVITHRFGYEEHEEAFETAASGQAGKVIMSWDGA